MENKRVFHIPKIRSMTDYINKNYRTAILEVLNDAIEEGTLRTKAGNRGIYLDIHNTDFYDIIYHQQGKDRVAADVLIAVMDGNEICDKLWCELCIWFEDEVSITIGAIDHEYNRPERVGSKLDKYLVPIKKSSEIENEIGSIRRTYLPDVPEGPAYHAAEKFACKMGLKVIYLNLNNMPNVDSTIFFKKSTVQYKHEELNEEGKYVSAIDEKEIEPGTIVVSSRLEGLEGAEIAIYHECLHYKWHYLFFRLQEMCNSNITAIPTKTIVVKDVEFAPSDPAHWMEYQASRGSYALFIPKGFLESEYNGFVRERVFLHDGEKFESFCRSLAAKYNFAKSRIRARLIQIGYVNALGALNYNEDHYILPYAFDANDLESGENYFIPKEKYALLLAKDKKFAELIDSGLYVYADGHVCLADSKCVRQGQYGLMLTDWANEHVDECCLKFTWVYNHYKTSEPKEGTLNSEDNYTDSYCKYAGDEGDSLKARTEKMRKIKKAVPDTFPEALKYMMKLAKIPADELSRRSYVPDRTIARLIKDEKDAYTPDTLVALAIGMNLPPWLSKVLLSRAGFAFTNTERHSELETVLESMFMMDIDDVQETMENEEMQPLKVGKWKKPA